MSEWNAYLKTAGLGQVLTSKSKDLAGRGANILAEGAALGLGIGSAEHFLKKLDRKFEQKMNKKSSAYDFAFRSLLTYLRALYQLHQFMHWRTKGQPFYGDHLLFQRLYEKAGVELDSVAEKAIGLSNDVDVIDPQEHSAQTAELLKTFQLTPAGALDAEKGFLALIKQVRGNLGEGLTDGLDNMLQEIADTHEGHVYLLQQRVAGGEKTAGVYRLADLQSTLAKQENQPGMLEKYRRTTGEAGAVLGAIGGGYGAGELASRARLGGKGRFLTSALGTLGGATLGGLAGNAPGTVARTQRLQKVLKETPQMTLPTKQASLDRALGSLYTEYGPPLQKHAAVTFFNYTLDKDRLDQEALGKSFCKMASASSIDPWVMAHRVVRSYANIVKMASGRPSQAQELAKFYVGWADEMIKKANILTSMGNLASKAKAVGGAVLPSLQSSKTLATKGVIKSEMPAMGQRVNRSMSKQQALQNMGGGSVARGKQLHQQGIAEGRMKADLQSQGWTPPAQAAQPRVIQGAPPPAPTQAAQPAAQQTPWGDYLRGGAVVGGLGLGGAAMMGGEPQPAYGEAYAQ